MCKKKKSFELHELGGTSACYLMRLMESCYSSSSNQIWLFTCWAFRMSSKRTARQTSDRHHTHWSDMFLLIRKKHLKHHSQRSKCFHGNLYNRLQRPLLLECKSHLIISSNLIKMWHRPKITCSYICSNRLSHNRNQQTGNELRALEMQNN